MSYEFSPAGYTALLGAMRDLGYEARNFEDADPAQRHLILRHDVDFSLEAAASMAELECRLGHASTYFVLLRTEFYNVFSNAGLAALRKIADFGHSIGLHFDGSLYPSTSDVVDAAVDREAKLLGVALGRVVTLMSFHRPAADRIGEGERIGGLLNAYGPRFVREMGYCSDSRGAWHRGLPTEHAAVREGRALQLLTHPFWWQSPAQPPEERLRRFVEERRDFVDQELERQCIVHKAGG
ncbi:MAG: hypothetical protein FJX62_02945 [Alphaproteobacteria bacterium]|nr:hypothetical protein [Alphaproteobacteria bacterium]